MRLLVVLTALLTCFVKAAEPAAIRVQPIPAPAHGDALGASLTLSPDGLCWLTWLERDGDTTALRCATRDVTTNTWSPPRTIASGRDWFASASDFPALTLGPGGRGTVVWFMANPAPAHAAHAAPAAHAHHGHGRHAYVSQTTDGGKTWSPGQPLTRESDSVEFVSLTTLADGRVLAAWLDGRAKKNGGTLQQLFSRIIGEATPDTLIDGSVCDCCHTSLTAFPDGTALVCYRGRTSDEIRDTRVARFRAGAWDKPRTVYDDQWKIAGCPVNGPQLASDGGRVAAAWFTAADNDPRVLAALSSDAGARFMMPVRISDTKPAGRVSTRLLHDGAMLVTWVDANGALWLRRVSPDFTLAPALQITSTENGRVKGFPRTALVRDYHGGDAPAELVIACTMDTNPALRTFLVTIPEAALLMAEQSCDCAPTADELNGFPIRGTLLATRAETGTVRVKHVEIPGIFDAGTREFKTDTSKLEPHAADRPFLARIEQRDGEWRLFNLRFIASAR